jgi:hypothetical protein
MSFINIMAREITFKVVYYGPGLCGKTTNLRFIHGHANEKARGRMVELSTEEDRTLYFDFFPLELGEIRGFKTRLQLYTVPGQVQYEAVRRLVLKGMDGCVFVADSQMARSDANEVSLESLEENLQHYGRSLHEVPLVVQYNKRDLPGILDLEELEETLNPRGVPSFEASAITGAGVHDTLKSVSKLIFMHHREAAFGKTS